MSFLKCLKYMNPNQLLGNKEFTNSILSVKTNHNLLNLSQDYLINFNQKRFARFKTVKRRATHKLNWWVKKTTKINHNKNLTLENQNFIQEVYKDQYSSPLVNVKIESKQWTLESKRTGLIARKIGVLPAWLKSGERITTTLLQVVDNHVINCFDVGETRKNTIYQNRWFTHDFATINVGAESGDLTKFTKEYCGLFQKAGIAPKNKISKFVITEDAILPPGTPLYAQHFLIGQYVDVFGKTIDRGFEGVVKRWGFKGDGPKHQGATKFHRRPGSIGQSRKSGGPMKGRKMAGHYGNERRTMRSLQVMRINTKYNIIYVKGQCVPGLVGSWCYVFDAMCLDKQHDPRNPPPFPTYIPKENEEVPENLFHPDLFVMDADTIIYPKVEEAKRRSGAKTARVRKK